MKRKVSLCILALFLGFLPANALAKPDKVWVDSSGSKPNVELKLPSFAPIIEELGEAVVNISIEGREPAPREAGRQLPGGDPFEFFFKMPPEADEPRTFSSLGSGFVIHPDGYIVTNNHVVEKATKILVSFKDDKKQYEAKVIGSDPKTDIALLKVDRKRKLASVTLGDSDSLGTGDWVIAIGNPFLLGHTATVGIVSAKSRKVPGGGPYDDFIQTDASINPGNSGGPLFNARGEVIGVNTAIFSPGRLGTYGFNIGIGFAVPINLVKSIIEQLHESGKVTRGWLGVLIQPVNQDVANALGLKKAAGALVADVVDESPAFKGGIQRGDVIIEFDGAPVRENDELPLMVAETEIGKKAVVKVIRAGETESLSVTIDELTEREIPEKEEVPEDNRFGLAVQELTPEIARSLDADSTEGVVVAFVEPKSIGAEAGLKRGDIIIEVGRTAVKSVSDFKKLTTDLSAVKPLLLLVKRNGSTIFLTLKAAE